MRNYPIGTFLFWNLKKETAQNYVFYEFLKKYDQRNPYNIRKEGSFRHEEITGILDGQQRLSSMYIGLQGTHTQKRPYMHWSNGEAFTPTKLYFNVLSLPYFISEKNEIEIDEEKNFEFLFLSDNDSKNRVSRKARRIDDSGNTVELIENMYWFRVGEILEWGDDPEFDIIVESFIEKSISEGQKEEIRKNKRLIKRAIETIYKRLMKEELINYFEVNKKELEDILKIFIRVNSGGTILSKTDLLFSTIVATWEKGREEIEGLLQKINSKGDRFNFTSDYLMRSCLVLSDASIVFKVNSFKSENVQKIKDEWSRISMAIIKMVDLLVEFGFNGSLLTSQNATVIISYYILKGGILESSEKREIQKYLVHSLLNGIYGSSPDQVISTLRSSLRTQAGQSGQKSYILKNSKFSFEDLLKIDLPSRKSFKVTEQDIDKFLAYKKSNGSFFVLTLLYPNLKYQEVQFHQDHIHPASGFEKSKLDDFKLTEEDRKQWLDKRDMLPNLQLMEGLQNVSKNASPFSVWINQKEVSAKEHFCSINFIPMDQDWAFSNFLNFFEKRREMLKTALKSVLAITTDLTENLPIEENSLEEDLIEEEIDYTESVVES